MRSSKLDAAFAMLRKSRHQLLQLVADEARWPEAPTRFAKSITELGRRVSALEDDRDSQISDP
jgi:hypothetical protein